jgi:hypothetical protein
VWLEKWRTGQTLEAPYLTGGITWKADSAEFVARKQLTSTVGLLLTTGGAAHKNAACNWWREPNRVRGWWIRYGDEGQASARRDGQATVR